MICLVVNVGAVYVVRLYQGEIYAYTCFGIRISSPGIKSERNWGSSHGGNPCCGGEEISIFSLNLVPRGSKLIGTTLEDICTSSAE